MIVGVNFGHDSAVTLVRDGRIVRSIEEEKISRVKQDHGWPAAALRDLFQGESLRPEDIEVVAFGSHFYNDLAPNEIRYRFRKERSAKLREYAGRVRAYYLGGRERRFGEANRRVFEQEVRRLGFTRAKVLFFDHHACHAAGALYCSPFRPGLVVTCDGHGDGASFNAYRPDGGRTGFYLVASQGYQASIGAFYSAITRLLGFRPMRHEGKITGLAAYGGPTPLVDELAALFGYDGQGRLQRFPGDEVERYWKEYGLDEKLTTRHKVNLATSESAVGTDYSRRFEVLAKRIEQLARGFSKEDVAYACQAVTERVVVGEVRRVIREHCGGARVAVALAGGVFSNVRVNQAIYEMDEVENVFVQPAMGDSGLALGAAILADIAVNERDASTDRYRFEHTYLGPEYDGGVEAFLDTIRGEAVVVRMEHPAREVAQLVEDNRVVGFWHGSMEWGPRALGRRSMILNTFDRTVNDSVNRRLSRTEFMPFAPSVIDYMATTYFPAYDSACPAGDYMTITYDVAREHHDRLQAVVHVDGTARPQVVRRETNPYYYDVIDEFYKLTGCGAIVNTSFNAHEEPIVSTPAVAYRSLKEGRIDVLVLNEYRITLPDTEPAPA